MLLLDAGDLSAASVASAWLPMLLDASIKGTLLIAAAGLLAAALRRASAATRHLVWSVALFGLLMLSVFAVTMPSWQVLPTRMAESADRAAQDRNTTSVRTPTMRASPVKLASGRENADTAPAVGNVDHAVPQPQVPPTRTTYADSADAAALDQPRAAATSSHEDLESTVHATTAPWQVWILFVWILGVLVTLLPAGLGMLSLWRLQRSAQRTTYGDWAKRVIRSAMQLGVNRRVTLLISDHRSMPMHWGILRPKLLLPAEADGWSEDRKRVVVLHELAHVKRYDALTQTVAQLACAMHWFNPLAWMALCKMRSQREAACDDLALATGCRPSDYAEHLLQIASGLEAGVLAAYGGLAMARRSLLEGRLLAILDPRRNRRAVSRIAVVAAILLATVLMVPLAIVRPQPPFQAVGGPSDPLGIRLVAVRPDARDDLYDPEGNLIGQEPDYSGEPAVWGENGMSREFILEWPRVDGPVLWVVQSTGQASQGGAGLGLWVPSHVAERPGGVQRSLFRAFVPRKRRGRFGFDLPVTRVDLTVHYYFGPRGPADGCFSGPFNSAQTVPDDMQAGYALTIEPAPAPIGTTALKLLLHAQQRVESNHTLIAYDTAGRRHLTHAQGGSLTDGRGELEYGLVGVPLEQIVTVTFNERTHEKTFRNVVVDYSGLEPRSHAQYLDEIAKRLGIANPDPQEITEYCFKSAEEAVSCIDLVHGYGVTQAWRAIDEARPRVTPQQLDEKQLERLHAAAEAWLTASKPLIRAHGIQLGLWGDWGEFFPPALAIVQTDLRFRENAARAIFDYRQNLSAEQIQQVTRVLLSRDDPSTHRDLINSLLKLPKSPAKNDALLELAQSDKPWLWWRALAALRRQREDGWPRLLSVAGKSPEMARRVVLALSPAHLPGTSQETVNEAYANLPTLLTAALLRIDMSLCHEVMQATVKHADVPTATAGLVRFLKQLLSEWDRSNVPGRSNMNYWAVDRTVGRLNLWYDMDIGGLGADLSLHGERDEWGYDWKAIAAEAIEWYETSGVTRP